MTPLPLSALPESLRRHLLAAATGKNHLADAARAALSCASADPQNAAPLLDLARELFAAAWLCDPLDGTTAADLAEFDRRLPGLSREAAKCAVMAANLCAVRPGYSVPPKLARLEEAGDYPALRDWLENERRIAPGNGFLAWNLFYHALANSDFSRASGVAESLARVPGLAPALNALRGDALFLAGEYEDAAKAYLALDAVLPNLRLGRAGEALFRAGQAERGLECMRRAVMNAPSLVNDALRLYDLTRGVDRKRAPLPGKTAVLLYSYNSADKLALTLENLFAGFAESPADVIVRVLSNGSKDGTEEIVRGFAERFGDRFAGIYLPVNVGAAPARNWLMHLPEVEDCAFAAYLDDDAAPPPGWLDAFGAAVAASPQAGVWGCRTVDYANPANMQQADLSLLPPREGETVFSMSQAAMCAFDFGQFSYLRPAASVTGCCHLFRTDVLEECGEFDIRYSPTQFDDLDHDLRLVLSGKAPVYQGHLKVAHMKTSGLGLHKSRAGSANMAANMYKLKHKYSAGEFRTIMDEGARLREEDYRGKMAALGLDF